MSELAEINGVLCLINLSVEKLLDEFTDYNWDTRAYQSKYLEIDNEMFISASLELVVRYDEKERTFVGAVSFPLSYFPNNVHFDNTAKTLCITNAASDLGKRFGRGLNKVTPVVVANDPIKSISVQTSKRNPDFEVLKAYQDAILKGDSEKIKNLNDIYNLPTE